jgi:hypothetical protein
MLTKNKSKVVHPDDSNLSGNERSVKETSPHKDQDTKKDAPVDLKDNTRECQADSGRS